MPEWERRFPDAMLFAPAQSIERVQRKTGLHPILPLAEAAKIAGPNVEFTDMPHYKTGEVLVRMNTARGRAWYVTDVVLNYPDDAPQSRRASGVLGDAQRPGPSLQQRRAAFHGAGQAGAQALARRRSATRSAALPHSRAGPVVECAPGGDTLRRVFAQP